MQHANLAAISHRTPEPLREVCTPESAYWHSHIVKERNFPVSYCFPLLLVLRCLLALANHLPLHAPVAATSWAFLACSLVCVPLM
ncbi:hypothetical protein OO184_10895 [Photorhabdus sp. APURE]|uniref:hypothetical protein n=1 Tax=Photorhabdus aballayi TaxID=2991723 RepID=UPI00223D510D|nr:hypothetical protein [Photorhabdus aballayi]MCW7548435.1 hypothetical protein [Photorhabdus aballayi]